MGAEAERGAGGGDVASPSPSAPPMDQQPQHGSPPQQTHQASHQQAGYQQQSVCQQQSQYQSHPTPMQQQQPQHQQQQYPPQQQQQQQRPAAGYSDAGYAQQGAQSAHNPYTQTQVLPPQGAQGQSPLPGQPGHFASAANPYAASGTAIVGQGLAAPVVQNPYHGGPPAMGMAAPAPQYGYPAPVGGAVPVPVPAGGPVRQEVHGAYPGPPAGFPTAGVAEPVPFAAIHNSMTGGAIQMTNGNYTGPFCLFVLNLNHVHEIFRGSEQGWNRKYKAAQQIFGQGVKSSAVRVGIQTQHAMLYSRTGKRVDTGHISQPTKLLELLNYGVHENHLIFFTYVITKAGEWRFSHTGASFLRDNLSKHAMHANVSDTVIFAGEFHIEQHNGTHVLVLDNNSGTYAPPAAMLPTLIQLFSRNFPGLQVDAWDREDPRLLAAIARCPTRR